MPIPLPPSGEQEAVVAEVETRLSVIAATDAYITASLKRAGRLRQSILKEAFAGRLVPQDPSDEPASVLLDRIRAASNSAATRPRTRRTKSEPAE
jgi:type I restriction enzyme S subunit